MGRWIGGEDLALYNNGTTGIGRQHMRMQVYIPWRICLLARVVVVCVIPAGLVYKQGPAAPSFLLWHCSLTRPAACCTTFGVLTAYRSTESDDPVYTGVFSDPK